MNPEIRASCLTGCTESTSSPISFQPKNWDLLKEREKAQKRNKWDFTLGGIIGLLRIFHLKNDSKENRVQCYIVSLKKRRDSTI